MSEQIWIMSILVCNHSVGILVGDLIVSRFDSLSYILVVDGVKATVVGECNFSVGLFMGGLCIVIAF